MSLPEQPRTGWYRRGVTAALVLYWLALATATHVPRVPQPLPPGFSDKWQHYVAYAGLGFLLAAWWRLRRPLTLRAALWLFAVTVVYGALDEVTQPFFGRDAELLDWRSDIIGGATGVALRALIVPVARRRRPGEPPP